MLPFAIGRLYVPLIVVLALDEYFSSLRGNKGINPTEAIDFMGSDIRTLFG